MNEQQRSELLRIARDAITGELRGQRTPCVATIPLPAASGGAFVTLRIAQRLRGCMGTFSPKPTLGETVESVARLAARDPRFTNTPLSIADLPMIHIEISALSPLEKTDSPADLNVGEHGIVIRRGQATGCFLPRVAIDFNFSAEEFLERCCTSKAGLPAGAWKRADTEVLLFTADVIEE